VIGEASPPLLKQARQRAQDSLQQARMPGGERELVALQLMRTAGLSERRKWAWSNGPVPIDDPPPAESLA